MTARFQLEDDLLGSVYVNHVWIDDLLSPDDFQGTFYRELFCLAVRDPKMRDVCKVSVWLLSNGREEDACLLGDIGSGVLATTPPLHPSPSTSVLVVRSSVARPTTPPAETAYTPSQRASEPSLSKSYLFVRNPSLL